MGIGNLTELTAADSTGVNALLIAICQELGVRAVLTTEVIPWARGAVREIDVARRLMHYAVTQRTIPKGIDDRLVTVKDPAMLHVHGGGAARAAGAHHRSELPHLRRRDGITVFNNERFVRGTDIQEIFDAARRRRADARVLPREGTGARAAGRARWARPTARRARWPGATSRRRTTSAPSTSADADAPPPFQLVPGGTLRS